MTDTSPTPAEISITVDDETFTFRTPSARDIARLGNRALRLRALDGAADAEGLDDFAAALYRASALMEILLIRADAEWPFTAGPDAKPRVESESFPTTATQTLVEIQEEFYQRLASMVTRAVEA